MTNHPIFDISPSALYRPHDNMGSVRQAPLYWLPGFEIAGSHSLIAACILTGQLDQYILQNFLLQVGFMEFDIDGYNSMLPACALQNIIYFCGI